MKRRHAASCIVSAAGSTIVPSKSTSRCSSGRMQSVQVDDGAWGASAADMMRTPLRRRSMAPCADATRARRRHLLWALARKICVENQGALARPLPIMAVRAEALSTNCGSLLEARHVFRTVGLQTRSSLMGARHSSGASSSLGPTGRPREKLDPQRRTPLGHLIDDLLISAHSAGESAAAIFRNPEG